MRSRYSPLADFLRAQSGDEIPMTFGDIERVLGGELPPAAYAHRAWWSNGERNAVASAGWRAAGFETCQVRMRDRVLLFRRSRKPRAYGGAETASPLVTEGGQAYAVQGRHPLIGALQGTVRIGPGTDLTQPADPDWGNA